MSALPKAVGKLWVFFLVRNTINGYTLPWNSTDTSLSWVDIVAASGLGLLHAGRPAISSHNRYYPTHCSCVAKQIA